MRAAAAAVLFGNLPKAPPALDHTEPSYLPRKWRDDLEVWTAPYREAKARWHRMQSYAATSGSMALWHARRAKGQAERFVKLANCGETFEAVGDCSGCDEKTRRPVHCGLVNLCPRCRGREARRLRKRVREMMGEVPTEWRVLGERGSRAWGWKLLTLTVPHGRGIEADARALARKLWPQFWRQFKAHVRKDCGEEVSPLYVRCLEIAKTGSDDGHAHYHVAVFAPFVHRSYVNLLWGRALERAGYHCPQAPVHDVLKGTHPGAGGVHWYYSERVKGLFVTRRGTAGRPLVGAIPFPVTDLRSCHGDVSNELVKYLVKDVDRGQRMPAKVFAKVYQAVDGMRRLSNSKALAPPSPEPMCCPQCERDTLTWKANALREPDTPPRGGRMESLRYAARDAYDASILELYAASLSKRTGQSELKLPEVLERPERLR